MAYVKVSRTYRFMDKDPVCDELRTLVADAGLSGKKKAHIVAKLATLSPSTIVNLFFGHTRKPQNATVMSIATSLGYERHWQRTTNKWDLDTELKAAREFIKRQAELRAKAKPEAKRKGKKKKGKTQLRLVG